MLFEEGLEGRGRQDQAAQRALGHDVSNRRFAEQRGDLAEEVAGPQRRAVDAVDADARRAIEDHVETAPGHALPHDPLALVEPGLLEREDEALELRRRQVGEEREPGEDVDDFLLYVHCYSVPSAATTGAAGCSAGLRIALSTMPTALTTPPSTRRAAPSTIAM